MEARLKLPLWIEVVEKGLATDGHERIRIETKAFICVHPCESVSEIEVFSILLGQNGGL